MTADPVVPFHVEAYPTIDLLEALREVKAGRDVAVWRDQEGAVVGMASLAFDAPGLLTIEAIFRKLWYVPAGFSKQHIACDVITLSSGQDDVLATSLGAEERSRVIVFANGEWQPREYHRLGYRSKIVADRVRDAERLAELDQQLAAGRVRYMRKATHAALVEEQARLQLAVGDRRRSPPLHQQQVLARVWMARPPAELEVTRLPPVPAGAVIGDVLELCGQPLFAGVTLQEQAERAIAAALRPAYRRLAAICSRVSALQVRRALLETRPPPTATLGDDPDLLPVQAFQLPLRAVLVVSIEGDPLMLDHGLPSPTSGRLPLGEVIDGELILEVAFSPENAAFVPILLQAELDLIEECLERQRRAAAQVAAGWPTIVKRIVAEAWPKLTRKRGRRT